jgi:hypothetical protein
MQLTVVDLSRRTWIFTAITVVSCAGFAARAASSIVTASYLPVEAAGRAGPPPAATQRAVPSRAGRSMAAGDQLVERNMFCSSCSAVVDPGAPGATLAVDIAPTQAVLVETSIGSEPRATVRVVASEVQGSWGLGEAIPGLGRVHRIAPQWIELVDPSGHHSRLPLLPSPEPAADRGSDTAMSESPSAAAPWSARITKLDDQHYEVDRGLIRELVTGVAKADGVRPVPILDHGEIKGVRLLGVSTTSIPFALGLHSGDSLTAIDGEPIKNVNQLLDLYARIDELSSVALSGLRAGKPLIRTLHLR